MTAQRIGLILGPVTALLAAAIALTIGAPQPIAATVAVTALTAVWWMTEALPIPATSLVPFAALPLMGVIDDKAAASALGNHVIVLLMGAFFLSKGLEKSGAHERLALYMIRLVGGAGGRRLLFGFMLASAVLSMWISNTATVLALTPIAFAILARTDDERLAAPLLLGIAYAASVGGTGTLIGTPPNLIFATIYEQTTGAEYGFVEWMKTGVPVVVLALPLMALWLGRNMKGAAPIHLPQPGPWRAAERRMLIVFGLAILAWITRLDPFGGWSGLFGISNAGDSTVALAATVLLFLVPNGERNAQGRRERLLDWKTANDIPWGMLLLFAGGICLAKGWAASGLSDMVGAGLAGAAALPPFLMILAICLAVTFMTEITSNTATATLLMPILAAASGGVGVAPEVLMIPAAMSASCAFMLPVATAPNAIVYGTGRVPIGRMVREGVALNIIVALVVAAVCWAGVR